MAARNTSWKLRDVIDFEYFLERDKEADVAELEARDRAFYRSGIEADDNFSPPGSARHRRWIFRRWLDHQRAEMAEPEALPGGAYATAHGLALKFLFVIGLIFGGGVASAILHYEGRHPVNVFVYFGSLVGTQIALVAIALLLIATRAHRWLLPELSLLGTLARRLVGWLAARLGAEAASRLPARERNRVRTFLAFISSRRMLFGGVLRWPLFLLFQTFGVAFNIGAIVATLALVVSSDRAFGWQSTVQFDPVSVHRAAAAVATPWSWFYPEGFGFPTLADVAGTRIVLKEGIAQLQTSDLISWWPFLCLSLVVYGFLPRLGLFISSALAQRRALAQLDFSYAACDRLFERMIGPRIDVVAEPNETEPHRSAEIVGAREAIPRALDGEHFPADSRVVLAPAEINSNVPGPRLEIGAGTQLDREQIRRVSGFRWADDQPKILVLQQAWQPPIAEFLNFIRQLRATLGERAKLTVGLVGKPLDEVRRAPVRESDFTIWRDQIEMIGDPYLRLERIDSDG